MEQLACLIPYSLDLRPSESVGLLKYRRPFFLTYCLLLLSLHLHLPQILLCTSSHLNLGLPLLILPSGLLSNIFLTVLP